MDAVLVEFAPDGRVRLEGEDWTTPTRQEIRAIIHAARLQTDELTELVESLERAAGPHAS
jgi:hypothetical protein